MRILYIARHGCGDNDDEGAVAYALEQLGHEVLRIHENKPPPYPEADFCLFHKQNRLDRLEGLRMPKAFWYFDLVDGSYDSSLAGRSAHRVEWMGAALRTADLGFCTDGDWVARDGTGKLRWLMQGMDERQVQMHKLPEVHELLFAGMVNHGRKRAEHIQELKQRYGDKLTVMDGVKRRVHGAQLAKLFASAKIVVAPDGPSTDAYWSNRVYLALGLGAFLLHPACGRLRGHFSPNELTVYSDRRACEMYIDYFLDRPAERQQRREAGHRAVKERHLYRHRCEQLLEEVERARLVR